LLRAGAATARGLREPPRSSSLCLASVFRIHVFRVLFLLGLSSRVGVRLSTAGGWMFWFYIACCYIALVLLHIVRAVMQARIHTEQPLWATVLATRPALMHTYSLSRTHMSGTDINTPVHTPTHTDANTQKNTLTHTHKPSTHTTHAHTAIGTCITTAIGPRHRTDTYTHRHRESDSERNTNDEQTQASTDIRIHTDTQQHRQRILFSTRGHVHTHTHTRAHMHAHTHRQ